MEVVCGDVHVWGWCVVPELCDLHCNDDYDDNDVSCDDVSSLSTENVKRHVWQTWNVKYHTSMVSYNTLMISYST